MARLLLFPYSHPSWVLLFKPRVFSPSRHVRPANNQEDFIYEMLAFPLSELGRTGDAEKAAKKGFEINKEDPCSQHVA